ncbi:hypothetical protein [Brevibacillus formosus]
MYFNKTNQEIQHRLVATDCDAAGLPIGKGVSLSTFGDELLGS